jgi:tRNA pseudouridine55 synthase
MPTASELHGVLLVDKPVGPTSFDVVQRVRRALGGRKAGHTGTLDPNATGLLAVCLGEATRLVPFLMAGEKSYRGVVRFGVTTDTLDAAGSVLHTADASRLVRGDVEAAVAGLTGVTSQVAPMYSAKRVDGERLHEVARRGGEVERAPFPVRILETRLEAFTPPDATVFVRCSKGTYIRTLAETLGAVLGTGAHLAGLRRLSSGTLSVEDALGLAEVERLGPAAAERLIPTEVALGELPALPLDGRTAASVAFGNALGPAEHAALSLPAHESGTLLRLLDPSGIVVAVGEATGPHAVKLVRVLKARIGPGLHRRA